MTDTTASPVIDYTAPVLDPDWLKLLEISEGSHAERERGPWRRSTPCSRSTSRAMPDLLDHGARGPAARSRLDTLRQGSGQALQRLTAVDHPDRSSSFPTKPLRPSFLSVDPAHALPLVAHDELGKEVARFRHLADLAHFLNVDAATLPTLPWPVVREARREDGDQLELLEERAA